MRKHTIIMTLFAIFTAMVGFSVSAESNFLADRHTKHYGVECDACHGAEPPTSELTEASSCLSCHESYEALGELTDKVDPNPHNNHMIYEDTSCGECHRSHKGPILMCDSCHQLDLKIK